MANDWVPVGVLRRWGDPSTSTGNTIMGSNSSASRNPTGAINTNLTGSFHQFTHYVKWANSIQIQDIDQLTHEPITNNQMKFGDSVRITYGETNAQTTHYEYNYYVQTDGYDVLRCKGATILECNVLTLSASGYSNRTPEAILNIGLELNTNIRCELSQRITTTGIFRTQIINDTGLFTGTDIPDSYDHVKITASIVAGSVSIEDRKSNSRTLIISDLKFL